MPSPPLAPDDGPIDIEHLQRMTLGNASLEREVLALFSVQAASLIGGLAALPANAGTLAHTLAGAHGDRRDPAPVLISPIETQPCRGVL